MGWDGRVGLLIIIMRICLLGIGKRRWGRGMVFGSFGRRWLRRRWVGLGFVFVGYCTSDMGCFKETGGRREV